MSELQLDVHHPLMFRSYFRKYDMEEPPKMEEQIDDISESRLKRMQLQGAIKDEDLEERYYK